MKIRIQNKIIYLMVFLLLFLVNICSAKRLSLLKEYADLIFVCYPAGSISGTTLDLLKENDKGTSFSGTALWKTLEDVTVSAESTGREQKVTSYQIKGQPEAVFGNDLIQGRYFTEEENTACLLGQGLARQLFGSENVLGMEVEVNQKTYQITGILKGDRPSCAVLAGENTEFDGVAVHKHEAGQSSALAISLIEAVFGSTDGQKVDGQFYYMTARLFYAAASALMLIMTGIAAAGRRKIPFRLPAAFCMAAAVWVLISGVKGAAPGADYLPTYWSDFDFFGRLFQEKAEQIQSLAAYQVFSAWQEMLRAWRQVIGAEVFMGVMFGIFCMALAKDDVYGSTLDKEMPL